VFIPSQNFALQGDNGWLIPRFYFTTPLKLWSLFSVECDENPEQVFVGKDLEGRCRDVFEGTVS
jgi:hypothetical protein